MRLKEIAHKVSIKLSLTMEGRERIVRDCMHVFHNVSGRLCDVKEDGDTCTNYIHRGPKFVVHSWLERIYPVSNKRKFENNEIVSES